MKSRTSSSDSWVIRTSGKNLNQEKLVIKTMEKLPPKLKIILKSIFQQVKSFCSSIYLSGSWAVGEGKDSSDLDLILITKQNDDKHKIDGILKRVETRHRHSRPIVDSKVYTRNELNKALDGLDHFLLQACLNKGILLWGEKITVSFNENRTYQAMAYWLDRLNETRSSLESYSQYTSSCVMLYAALVWFYFLERYVLLDDKHPLKKDEILAHYFGKELKNVSKCYYGLAREIRSKKNGISTVIMHVKDDPNLTQNDYENLLIKSTSIMAYVEQVYRLTSNRFDF